MIPTPTDISLIFTFIVGIYTLYLKMESNKKVNITDFNTVMADITKLVDSLATTKETKK